MFSKLSIVVLAAGFFLGALAPMRSEALSVRKQCVKEQCGPSRKTCIRGFAERYKAAKEACANVGTTKDARVCSKREKDALKRNRRACKAAYTRACKPCCAGELTASCLVHVDDPGVNAYVRGLPSWNEFSPPKPNDDGPQGPPLSEIDWDRLRICSTQECSITSTPEDIVTYNPGSEVLYLGSLIQGKTYAGGLGTMEELPIRQRAPLIVSIDLHTPDSSRIVEGPTLATVSDAIHDLVVAADVAGHKAGSSIFFDQTSTQSLEQSMLKLGLSARYMGATVRASLEAERTSEEHTLTAYFKQRMFTTSVVLPQTPASVFSPELTREHLLEQESYGRIGPDNLPVFVSNIVWGRMMTLTMTSTKDEQEMKAALSASYAGIKGTVGAEHLKTLQEATIKLVTIGGDAQAALDYLRTGDLGEFFKEDAPLTTAVPLSYTLRNLGDNSIAKVSETTAYDIVECGPLSAVAYFDEVAWRNAVQSAAMSIREFDTTAANLAKAAERDGRVPGANEWMGPKLSFLSADTGFPFDFSLENTACPYDQGLVYSDDDMEYSSNNISIGNVDQCEDDDFDIVVSGDRVYAIGVTIEDNSWNSEEYVELFAAGQPGEHFLQQFRYGADGFLPTRFVGMVSPVPLRRYVFNEDTGGDDIQINNFRFGIR